MLVVSLWLNCPLCVASQFASLFSCAYRIHRSIYAGSGAVKRSNCLTKNLTLANTLPHVRILPAPEQTQRRWLEGSEAMMSQHSREELLATVSPRYHTAKGKARERILDEFVASTINADV